MNERLLLRSKIQEYSEKLEEMQPGSEEFKATTALINQFTDRLIELEKADMDIQDKREAREHEKHLKMKDSVEAKKDRFVKTVTTVGLGVLKIGVSVFIAANIIKAEQTGNPSSILNKFVLGDLFSKDHY